MADIPLNESYYWFNVDDVKPPINEPVKIYLESGLDCSYIFNAVCISDDRSGCQEWEPLDSEDTVTDTLLLEQGVVVFWRSLSRGELNHAV